MRNWLKQWPVFALLVASLFALAAPAPALGRDGTPGATPTVEGGLPAAVAWLQSQQADDGGFVGLSEESDPGATVDAIIALAAAEESGTDTGDAIDRAVGYLGSGDIALVYLQTGVGQAAKLVLGLVAAGEEPSGFAHVDPLSIIPFGVDAETGLYGTGVYDHALAVQALAATGGEIPQAAVDAFAAAQSENGGWAFDASSDPAMADSNTTAVSIQALVAAGHGDSDLVMKGLAYLDSVWTDGGAAYNHLPDTLPDANSTALVTQALAATGADISEHLAVLATFQNASGAFHYNADDTSDNLFATLQAIPAMATAGAGSPATPVAFHVALAA